MAGQRARLCSPETLKLTLVLVAFCIAGYIIGPPLYWHLLEGLVALSRPSSPTSVSTSNTGSCDPCICDCSSQPRVIIPEGMNNVSFTDCAKLNVSTGQDAEKNFSDLLTEELKLREAEAAEGQKQADIAFLEAKKLTSQYQKEADKCNSGMATCEEARERAERALLGQQKLTMLWESRARQKGWKDGTSSRSKTHPNGASVQSV